MKARKTEGGPAPRKRSRAAARRRPLVVVITAMLALQACAQVPTHRTLPDLPATDGSFRPTVEAYAEAPGIGGNRVTLLQNGDEIFPAQLAAIRSARVPDERMMNEMIFPARSTTASSATPAAPTSAS